MFRIRDSRKKTGNIFSGYFDDLKKSVDPGKERILFHDISLGLRNSIAYRKYSDFHWPLWLYEAADYYSREYRSSPNPVLLNTNFREWQTFTNYLSDDEIHIDRIGMISGPGMSRWSLEFWVMNDGIISYPLKNRKNIKAVRDDSTGEIVVSGNLDGYEFCQRIAGGNTGINEALVNYEIKPDNSDSILLVVVRPYSCTTLGGINRIDFNESGLKIAIDGVDAFALERKPDFIEAGSGNSGDIKFISGGNLSQVQCPEGMAAMAFCYNLKKGKNTLNLRVSLETDKSIPDVRIDYLRGFKEFQAFSGIRMSEGLRIEVPDETITKNFNQAKITLFTNNSGDFDSESVDGYRNLYFFSYAMNRAGLEAEAEKLVSIMMERMKFNPKNPEHLVAISACYLVNAFVECYLHKRDAGFLQGFFPSIRKIADYIYNYSTSIHSLFDLPGGSMINSFINEPSEKDFVIFLSAMSNASYLARCMGIFGDEVRYKNESDRLQSIVRNSLGKRVSAAGSGIYRFYSLFSLPDAVITGYKDDDYRGFLADLEEPENFPVFDTLNGIDTFTSALILLHMISLKDHRFNLYYEKFFSLFDDFFTLPEFMDPILKRGVSGDGNMKITAALILVIIRNRIFLDRADRLEIFPVPDRSWFDQGGRVKIENALTRYGRISFISESSSDEIKITFSGPPKYIPSDILINIPVESTIIESDDFILKKKIGNSYIINGWPAVVRFSLVKRDVNRMDNTEVPVTAKV